MAGSRRPSPLDGLLRAGGPARTLRELALPRPLEVLVLAPHPDDFDAIALTLHHLQRQGHALHVAVLTTGASGVQEGFEGASDDAAKAILREAEQRASCALFGLPPGRLHFLRLWGSAPGADADGPDRGAEDPADLERLRTWIAARPADLLFLPHGNDSNRTHRRTFEAVRAVAAREGLQAWAFLNRDAKTIDMRVDLFFEFGADDKLYGPLWFKGQVVRVDVDAGSLSVVADGFKVPAAVNFDSKGNLWVVDTALGQLVRVDPKTGAKKMVAQLKPALDNLAIDANDRLGAPVGPALDRLAATVRAEVRRRDEARARTVPVRLLFPLVFLVLPAFGLLTVVPALLVSFRGL